MGVSGKLMPKILRRDVLQGILLVPAPHLEDHGQKSHDIPGYILRDSGDRKTRLLGITGIKVCP